MSDWGKVLLYYDYEGLSGYSSKEPRRIRGLVSKAYQSPGTDGMILHAYNGLEYFKEHCNNREIFYDLKDYYRGFPGWEELSKAFDVFFDLKSIHCGYDDVKYIMDRREEYKEKEESFKEIEDRITNVEGTFGWIFMSYTGNMKEGNKLRYGYFAPGIEPVIKGFRDALYENGLWYCFNNKDYPEETREHLEPLFKVFEEEASLITSEEEFWEIGRKSAEYIKEIIDEGE